MLRALLYWLILAALVAVAWFLVEEQPGRVALEWWGYRVDTSIGVLLLASALVAAAVAVLYRLWRGLRRAPKDLGDSLRNSRQRRGYRALTQGMVAVAAGEPAEAQRWARKADELLDEPPLTMLLSAQAAQLNGDDQAAKRYFDAMLKRDETRFLGLRGLINQALREGDEAAALAYVREAYSLRPRTPWVLNTLFDLSERAGNLSLAERAVQEAQRTKTLAAPEAKRRRGVLMLEQALESQFGHARSDTIKLARQAHKAAPDLVPATLLYAELLVGSGRLREAARVLEKAWAAGPHPDLVAAYRATRPAKTGIDWLTRVGKLVAGQPKHAESLLAQGEAALDAALWGEARRYLGAAADAALSERVCRLMARLEEAEHGNADKAREWLFRAAEAPPEAAWVCRACGTAADAWTARCAACREFDALAWRTPPHVAPHGLAAATLEGEAAGQPVLPATAFEVTGKGRAAPATAPVKDPARDPGKDPAKDPTKDPTKAPTKAGAPAATNGEEPRPAP